MNSNFFVDEFPDFDEANVERKNQTTWKRIFLIDNFIKRDAAILIKDMQQVSGLTYEQIAEQLSNKKFGLTIDGTTIQRYAESKVKIASDK